MSLEHKLKHKKNIHIQRTPTQDVSLEVKKGNKFILVNNDFQSNNVPLGYMLIDMKYHGDSFKTLVPQNLLIFLANPGEGNIDDALDEIGDFYDEVQNYEDDLLEENGCSVQGTNWGVTARNAYSTYLINKLTEGSSDDIDVPVWSDDIKNELDLDDNYVATRVRAIAPIALEKDPETLRNYDLGDVLKHVTIKERKVENLTRQEFDKITCYAGSHYEIKEEYKKNPDVEYRVDHNFNRNHRVGQKITNKRDVAVLDARICDLEDEIEVYRKEKGSSVSKHDKMLLRQYTNVTYIAKVNSEKQLEIRPRGKINE